MRPFHVAIVGSGPSGFFAAASLLKAADASDDIAVIGVLGNRYCYGRQLVQLDYKNRQGVLRQKQLFLANHPALAGQSEDRSLVVEVAGAAIPAVMGFAIAG